jgi:hypothetical protein
VVVTAPGLGAADTAGVTGDVTAGFNFIFSGSNTGASATSSSGIEVGGGELGGELGVCAAIRFIFKGSNTASSAGTSSGGKSTIGSGPGFVLSARRGGPPSTAGSAAGGPSRGDGAASADETGSATVPPPGRKLSLSLGLGAVLSSLVAGESMEVWLVAR